jgi:hypothetical protein
MYGPEEEMDDYFIPEGGLDPELEAAMTAFVPPAATAAPAALAAFPASAAAPICHAFPEGAQPVMLRGTGEPATDGGGGGIGGGGTLQQSGSGDTDVHMGVEDVTGDGMDAQAASAGAFSTVDGIDIAVGMETDEGLVASDRIPAMADGAGPSTPSDASSRHTKRKNNAGGVVPDEKDAHISELEDQIRALRALNMNPVATPPTAAVAVLHVGGAAAVAVHVDWDKIHPLVKQAALGGAEGGSGPPGRDRTTLPINLPIAIPDCSGIQPEKCWKPMPMTEFPSKHLQCAIICSMCPPATGRRPQCN